MVPLCRIALRQAFCFFVGFFGFCFCFFCILGPFPGQESHRSCSCWPMSQPQATWDPSHTCDQYHSSQQHQILNPQSEARDRTHILILVGFITHSAMVGTLSDSHFVMGRLIVFLLWIFLLLLLVYFPSCGTLGKKKKTSASNLLNFRNSKQYGEKIRNYTYLSGHNDLINIPFMRLCTVGSTQLHLLMEIKVS